MSTVAPTPTPTTNSSTPTGTPVVALYDDRNSAFVVMAIAFSAILGCFALVVISCKVAKSYRRKTNQETSSRRKELLERRRQTRERIAAARKQQDEREAREKEEKAKKREMMMELSESLLMSPGQRSVRFMKESQGSSSSSSASSVDSEEDDLEDDIPDESARTFFIEPPMPASTFFPRGVCPDGEDGHENSQNNNYRRGLFVPRPMGRYPPHPPPPPPGNINNNNNNNNNVVWLEDEVLDLVNTGGVEQHEYDLDVMRRVMDLDSPMRRPHAARDFTFRIRGHCEVAEERNADNEMGQGRQGVHGDGDASHRQPPLVETVRADQRGLLPRIPRPVASRTHVSLPSFV
eukprot:PhM_4_TR9400/c0_g1_i1/m.347